MKLIRASINEEKQSISYVATFEHNDSKIKINIKSDSYTHQCNACAYIWSENKWNHITNIHYSNMNTSDGLLYAKHIVSPIDFQNDTDQLIKQVLEIID